MEWDMDEECTPVFGGTGKGCIEYQKSVTWCLVSRDNRREWSYGAAMVTLPAAPTEPLASAALSFALAGVFRGRFCEILLRDRVPASFEEDAVVYNLGDTQRALWFVRGGVVKIGTIIADGREIIYDVRKEGDVFGELCAFEPVRRDRAVVVERADLVSVPFHDAMAALAHHPAALQDLVEVLGGALAEAYDQLNSLANDDLMGRVVKTLRSLASKLGEPHGELVEIATYLTQDEVAQMVMARRERVSTALNILRQRGVVQYSPRGRMRVDMRALTK
jgi:CRP/FNR family cyclic AMP-dependent transcriptional regulator